MTDFRLDAHCPAVVRRSDPHRFAETSLHGGAWTFSAPSSVVVPFPVPKTDFGLVDALRVKHPSALRALCDRHSGELLKVATRLLGCEDQVVPLVIKTLKHSLQNLDDLVEPRALRLWLLMRLVDSVRWHLRWRAVRRRLWPQLHLRMSEAGICNWRSASTYRLLDELSVEARLTFCLVFIASMKPPDAAIILGTSVSKVELNLRQAQQKLRRFTAAFESELHAARPPCGSVDSSLGRSIALEQDRYPHVQQLYEFDLTRQRTTRLRTRRLRPSRVRFDQVVLHRVAVPLLLLLGAVIGVVLGCGRTPIPFH